MTARQGRLPGMALLDRVKEAVDFLQHYCGNEPVTVGFSGGKDSCVILKLAELANLNFQAWYKCTTIDPPEVMKFIKRNYSNVHWDVPKNPSEIW